MNHVNYSSLNYNKNIFTLREKVSQDVYLKTSLFNISTRKNMYKFKPPVFQYCITSPRSKLSTMYSKGNCSNKSSTKSITLNSTKHKNFSTINKTRTVTLYESLLNSKEKVQRVKTMEIQKENENLKKRIKRISSPLSRKKLDVSFRQNQKYYNNCKKVRTNSEVNAREKHILNRLPKLYLKKGRFVCY